VNKSTEPIAKCLAGQHSKTAIKFMPLSFSGRTFIGALSNLILGRFDTKLDRDNVETCILVELKTRVAYALGFPVIEC